MISVYFPTKVSYKNSLVPYETWLRANKMESRLLLLICVLILILNDVQSCSMDQFHCNNGGCTNANYQCDGGNDCSDGSDETDCMCTNGPSCYRKPITTCDGNQFACSSGACIPSSWVCDGEYDCADLSDEHINCDIPSCAPYQFTCDNGACIDARLKCNTKNDCGDNSDEIVCQIHALNGGVGRGNAGNHTDCGNAFRCKDDHCVPQDSLCNGIYDCLDMSDEDGKCLDDCKHISCDHGTQATPSGCLCTCRTGYRLAGDGLTCVDMLECTNDPPVCGQLCREAEGSYSCGCFKEFTMRYDNTSCKSRGELMTIYFSVRNQIREYTPARRNLRVVHQTTTGNITKLDGDITTGVLYYSARENSSLHQLFVGNQSQKSIANVGEATQLAIDWITQNVYFVTVQNYERTEEDKSEARNNQLKVCNFGQRHCAAILNTNHVTALVVDAMNKHLFLAINESVSDDEIVSRVYCSSLDGVHNRPIATFNSTVTDMTSDYRKQHVYVVKDVAIDRINYDGSHLVNIVETLMRIRGLNIFEDHLYFLTEEGLTMHKCRLFGDARRCTSFRLSADPTAMFVIAQSSRQTPGRNVCVNYNCSQLCVPNDRDGASCFCENGHVVDEHSDCRE